MHVDTFNGEAWVSIVPFQLSMNVRLMPEKLWPIKFNELNVRTYVRVNNIPGIYFFSLDANDFFSVSMARTIFNLNYFNANVKLNGDVGNRYDIDSTRQHIDMPHSRFNGWYQPTGEVLTPFQADSLENWITSRWCFFCPARDGQFIRGDIHHEPWPLQHAKYHFKTNTLLKNFGLDVTTDADRVTAYFAKKVHVLAWPKKVITVKESLNRRDQVFLVKLIIGFSSVFFLSGSFS